MKSKNVAFLGVMGALALVLSFLEGILVPDIPFLPVGAKPGLSNIVTMYTASVMGLPGALMITLMKGLFAFVTRGATAAVMSLCGGVLSTVAVSVAIKYEGRVFSFLGIGICGAIMHNMGQLAGACFISGSIVVINYAKYLLIFSLVTGSLTGLVLMVLMPRVKKIGSLK